MDKRLLSSKTWISSMIVIWSLVILGGFYQLWDYSSAPGKPGAPPVLWPKESRLQQEWDKPTLLIFAHPRCPCTRASFRELERILAHVSHKITTHVIFYHPKKFSVEWVKSDLWNIAQRMPVQSISIDSLGSEIQLFRPQTSGQVYLYSTENGLIYSGGITASRGHEGDNDGRTAILSYVLEKKVLTPKTFVFGCSLFHDGESVNENSNDDRGIIYEHYSH